MRVNNTHTLARISITGKVRQGSRHTHPRTTHTWAMMSITGRARYGKASSHPEAGAPSTKGSSQAVPLPDWRAATVVGPAREGIQ
jgi:hypothetical protein